MPPYFTRLTLRGADRSATSSADGRTDAIGPCARGTAAASAAAAARVFGDDTDRPRRAVATCSAYRSVNWCVCVCVFTLTVSGRRVRAYRLGGLVVYIFCRNIVRDFDLFIFIKLRWVIIKKTNK